MAETMRWYLGIDPGSPIALAVVDCRGKLLATATDEKVAIKVKGKWNNSPTLCANLIHKWIRTLEGKPIFVLERVSAMPNQGIVSTGKFLGSAWMIRGIASALMQPVIWPTPQVWKKHYGLKGGVENKQMSIDLVKDLWPEKVARFRYKKSHSIAEAALLGRYGYEMERRGEN